MFQKAGLASFLLDALISQPFGRSMSQYRAKFLTRILHNINSMGNECRTSKKVNDYLDHQLQIYKWRADVRHNTHIARTYLTKSQQNSQRVLTKMISYQLSSASEVNLQQLIQQYRQEEGREGLEGFLGFQRYCGSVVALRGQLGIEENVYALNSLLSGYENIHRKLGEISVDQQCCFVTEEGQLRAWINTDATLNHPDYQITDEETGSRYKAIYSSEASICKRILDIAFRLSDKNNEFMLLYQQLKLFTARNILQNLSFRAIRTFLNGYVYKHRIKVPNTLIKAIQRASTNDEKGSLSNAYQSNTFFHQSEEGHVSQSDIGIQCAQKSMQTSRVIDKGISTTFNTPRRDLNHSKRLTFSSSQFFIKNNNDQMNESYEEDNKAYATSPQFTKKVNFLQSQESKQSILLIPDQKMGKMMKFHSYHPSKSEEMHYKKAKDKEEIDLCSMKHSRNVSMYQQNHTSKADIDLLVQDSSSHLESRALTRMVSGLVSNKEITVCESMGSFQSINRSNDSGYEGVLLTMGRSVMNPEPTRKRISYRGPNNRAPHPTF